MKPRALILDVGGVLTTPVVGSFLKFCEMEGIELDDIQIVTDALVSERDDEHPISQLETGRMDLVPFEEWLAVSLSEGLNKQIVADGIAHRLVSNVALEERMFEAARRARAAGIKTALLSNSWGRTDYPPLFTDLFDAVVISGAVGLRKPDAQIYHLTADRLEVPNEDCVLVDDIEVNCAGARAAGWQAIHHTDPEITIPELEAMLGIDLRATAEPDGTP